VASLRAGSPAPCPMSGSCLVIIPAFNEAANLPGVVADVTEQLPEADILVVDDGSSDSTATAALRAGARVLRLRLNCGYGVALQAGFKYASRHGYELVAQMDADGQHLGRYLPDVLGPVSSGEADLVVGSRFLDGDGHYQPSVARKVGMELFGRIAALIMRQPVTDPTSGYQAMNAKVVELFCTAVYPSDFPDADVLVLLHRSGFTVAEVPVQMRTYDGPSMHGGHGSIYYVYKMFLSIGLNLFRPASSGGS
jgi:glycosyltransferase involved in cell wall biosynthesis